MNIPCMKSPCKNCPFKRDTLKGWLGKKRMTEILNSDSFVCHKNTSKQCAGHMLIKGDENSFVAFAKLIAVDLGVRGRELVFDSKQDCIDHHTF